MKTKLFMLLLAVCFSSAAFAQAVSFGPRVGTNMATMRLSDSGLIQDAYNHNAKYITGPQAGVVVNYKFSDLLSFQPELLYSQKGVKFDNFDFFDFFDTTGRNPTIGASHTRSGYLELPLLAKVSIGTENVQGFFTGGPTVSYLMHNKITYTEASSGATFVHTRIGGQTDRFVAGANFGVGAGYKVGTNMLNLDLRYGLDLTGEGAKSRVFSLSLAYLFRK